MRDAPKRLLISIVCSALVLATGCDKKTTAPATTCAHAQTAATPASSSPALVCFVASLIGPRGLVRSRPGEENSTGWKNALAGMVFLHEGRVAEAGAILDVFRNYVQAQGTAFRGLPKEWSVQTGAPYPQGTKSDLDFFWVGDGSLVLRTTQYYGATTGDHVRYTALENALKSWLALRADDCANFIAVAEGSANVYAALSAYRDEPAIAPKLTELRKCFDADVQYDQVLDHTIRAALVFGDPSGLAHVDALERTETWCVDGATTVRAYAAASGQAYVNVDISTQLLLAWKLWRQESGRDLAFLADELMKLQVAGGADTSARGLPYLVTQHEFDNSCRVGIVDATAFMLFAIWQWNPFSISNARAVP